MFETNGLSAGSQVRNEDFWRDYAVQNELCRHSDGWSIVSTPHGIKKKTFKLLPALSDKDQVNLVRMKYYLRLSSVTNWLIDD